MFKKLQKSFAHCIVRRDQCSMLGTAPVQNRGGGMPKIQGAGSNLVGITCPPALVVMGSTDLQKTGRAMPPPFLPAALYIVGKIRKIMHFFPILLTYKFNLATLFELRQSGEINHLNKTSYIFFDREKFLAIHRM